MQKTKGLSPSEREERGHGKGVGVYATLMHSDTLQSYGRTRAGTRTVSASEREECGHGEGVSKEDVRESTLCTYDVACSRKVARRF